MSLPTAPEFSTSASPIEVLNNGDVVILDDTTVRYRNFRLHNRLVLVARDGEGQIRRWKWLRSVAERRGAFKIYSTTD